MSLRDVDLLPSASAVANALVELAQPRLDRAWTYLADWDGLEAARVPAPFRRELLDRDALGQLDLETESVIAVRDWARHGAFAPRVLVGQLGVGKSYAGARWAHDRHRAGKSTLWVSVSKWAALDFDTLRAELRRALTASAVIIDDLGTGSSMYKLADGKKTLSMIGEAVQTLLLDRTNDGLPTLVLLNGEWKPALGMLGRRLIDRMRLMPGKPVVVITSTESLRKALPEDDVDKAGRGRLYRRAMVLLETFGAVNDSGVPFDFRYGSPRVLTSSPSFGGKLITRLTTQHDWLDEAERARKLLDLDTSDLVARARLIQTDTETGWAAQAHALLARLRGDMAQQRRDETQAKARAAAEVVESATRMYRDDELASWRHGPYGQMRVPELDVEKLRGLGFRVEQAEHGGTWTLRREQAKAKSPKATKRGRQEAPMTTALSLGHPTDADAWALANAIAFGRQQATAEAAA
ncbi:MAG TPA: hypothetical protein VM869_23380 [Enhygromyxa sp.]|nr:hypothetical protein [Enhygromyxa sp.]